MALPSRRQVGPSRLNWAQCILYHGLATKFALNHTPISGLFSLGIVDKPFRCAPVGRVCARKPRRVGSSVFITFLVSAYSSEDPLARR
jgi:hypothetical protein